MTPLSPIAILLAGACLVMAAEPVNLAPFPQPETLTPFSLAFTGSKVTASEGTKPAPWSATCWDANAQGEFLRSAEPLADKQAYVLRNVAGAPSSQAYNWKPIALPAGRIYTISLSWLAADGSAGALIAQGEGVTKKTLPLNGTAGLWKTANLQVEQAQAGKLSLMLQNLKKGVEHAISFRDLSVVDAGPVAVKTTAEAEGAGVIERGEQPLLKDTTDPLYRTLVDELTAFGPAWLPHRQGAEAFTSALEFVSFDGSAQAARETVTDTPGFTTAWRVTTPKTDKDWYTHLQHKNTLPIRKGDTLYFTLWAKVVKTRNEWGEGQISLYWGNKNSGNSKEVFGSDWRRIHYSWVNDRDYAPGEHKFLMTFGDFNQQVLLGGLCLVNLGPNVNLSKLPHQPLKLNYEGREPDAAWRKEALERIERIRTAPLKVEVVDAKGKPVSDATVAIEMTRQAFTFGSNMTWILPGQAVKPVAYFDFLAQTPQAMKDRVIATFLDNFNTLNCGATWSVYGGADSRISRSDWLIPFTWAKSHGIPVDQVQVVYPSPEFCAPPWGKRVREGFKRVMVDKQPFDPVLAAEFSAALKGLIQEYAKTLKPHGLRSFQIANEFDGRPEFTTVLGGNPYDRIAEWFQWAYEADPTIQRWINNPSSTDEYHTLVAALIERKAPLDGIGFQWHSKIGSPSPLAQLAMLDRWTSDFKLPLEITEFEVTLLDGKDQAQREFQRDYFRDVLIACYSHSNVHGFTLQDFWQRAAWQRTSFSAIYDDDLQLMPHGQMWRDLVRGAWFTRANGRADTSGQFTTRGHFGSYQITARRGSLAGSATVTLDQVGLTTKIMVR